MTTIDSEAMRKLDEALRLLTDVAGEGGRR
jgi:hypothetical protein